MNQFKFHKRRDFLIFLQKLSALEGNHALHSPAPSKKQLFSLLQFDQEENIHGHSIMLIEYSFERWAYRFVLKVSRYCLSPNRQSRKRMLNTVLMVNICQKYLWDKSMLFIHYFLVEGQKLEPWFVSPEIREYLGVETTAFFSKKWPRK